MIKNNLNKDNNKYANKYAKKNVKIKKKRIRRKSIRKNSFSKKVFEYLKNVSLDVLDLSVNLMVDPSSIIKKTSYGNHIPYYSEQRHYFKSSPYFKEKDNKIYVTPKGRIKIIKDILKDKLNKEAEWKGFWWAIAFDIPEKQRQARDLLRRELKAMHFVEAQKSIWVTPYDIEKELSVLLKLWLKNLGENIRIFKIEKIINDKDLKGYFEIN
jgi:hypothetical protein